MLFYVVLYVLLAVVSPACIGLYKLYDVVRRGGV
jgi:hypothetical protein